MSFTFACVLRSGGVYTPDWVARLCRDAATHLKPSRSVCLTDVDWGCPDEILKRDLLGPWPGWFSKLELFRPGLFDGPVLYVDLDSLILKPIPLLNEFLARLGKAWTSLALLDDFYAPNRAATGVMAWTPSPATEAIYTEFARRPVIKPGWNNGDGSIIGQYPHYRLQAMFPGAFQSWKVQEKLRKPVTGSVLCFHGEPKNNSFPANHWVTKHWIGLSNDRGVGRRDGAPHETAPPKS